MEESYFPLLSFQREKMPARRFFLDRVVKVTGKYNQQNNSA